MSKPDLLNWKFYIQACRTMAKEMGVDTQIDILESLLEMALTMMTPAQRRIFALNDWVNAGLYDAFDTEEEYASALRFLHFRSPFGPAAAFANAFAFEFFQFVHRHQLEVQTIDELIASNPARYDGMFWGAEAPFRASVAEAAREFGLSAQEADEAAHDVWSQLPAPEFEMKSQGREKEIFMFLWVYGARAVSIARDVHMDFERGELSPKLAVPKTLKTKLESMADFARAFIERREAETSCGSTVPGSLRLNS